MSITALYRDYLRNARRLPTLYLRQFFEIRARDNVDRVVGTKQPDLRQSKLKTVARELRRLKAANNKDVKAFDRILSIAYGRIGKLRWELLDPILTDPSTETPSTPPPSFSPELTKLLMTASPRMKRPWAPHEFTTPRGMPARFDPTHPDALLLKRPFDRRREANLRRRWFAAEIRRVQPPVEVLLGAVLGPGVVQHDARAVCTAEEVRRVSEAGGAGSEMLRPMGMQGAGVVKGIMDVVGTRAATRQPLTRRERATATPEEVEAATPPPQHPSRWVRRRFRALLPSMHQLVYVGGIKNLRDDAKQKSPFVVTTSPMAFGGEERVSLADPASLAWIGDIHNDNKNGNGSKSASTTKGTQKPSSLVSITNNITSPS